METLTYIIIFLSIGMFWKRQHQKLAHEKFRSDISALREKLVMLALTNKVDSNSFAFKYHLFSLEKTLEKSYFFTFPFMFLLNVFHKDDKLEMENFRLRVQESTRMVPELAEIQREMTMALFRYMKDQHFVTLLIVKPVFKVFGEARKMKKKYDNIIGSAFILPETSASDRYTMNQALC